MSVRSQHDEGFALILALSLLSVLMLVVLAMSVLLKIHAGTAAMAVYQTQARQNAEAGLAIALGELQRYAGRDDCITGMAGMTGVPPQNSLRQWCGVWMPGALWPVVWLTSGYSPGGAPALTGNRIVIVGPKTVGSPADRTDQEVVEAGLVEISSIDATGTSVVSGHLAYWVADEGAKVSAVILDAELQSAAISGTSLRPDYRRLIDATFSPTAATNSKVISLQQLKQAATGVSLTGSFHSLTHSSRALPTTGVGGVATAGGVVVGAFNINTTSEAAWRAWLEYPDHAQSVFGLDSRVSLDGARRIRNLLTQRARPFSSVDELAASGLIQDAFNSASPKILSPTAEEFLAELRPILAVRSDTFRVRAYGEAVNPVSGLTEATAFCEAMVQRTAEFIESTADRRFVITYFRWLGPDDI